MKFVLKDQDGDYFCGREWGKYTEYSKYSKDITKATVFSLELKEGGKLQVDPPIPEELGAEHDIVPVRTSVIEEVE